MLWYIIDGWNLIYKVPSIKNSSFPKRSFVAFIKKNNITGSRNNKVTIVFDGRIDIDFIRAESVFEIVFSGEGSADDIICKKAQSFKNKTQLRIVTDDREIISQVKSMGAHVVKAQEFLNKGKKIKSSIKSKDIDKKISYADQKLINDELRKIWLKE